MEVLMRYGRLRALVLGLSLGAVSAACGGSGGGGGGPATPTLTAVNPPQGPLAGGTAIALTGTLFTGATQVTVGGALAMSLVVVSDTSITCVTPAGAAGAAAVVVSTPSGPATLGLGFTYRVVPTLTGVAPPSGTTTGGTSITLTGSGYLGGVTQVTVGGNPAVGVSVVNDTTCTCLTPASASAVTVHVVITTPGGVASLPLSFTYTVGGNPLTLTSMTPGSGFTSGGGKVTLVGTGFTSGSPGANGVTFDGISATSVVAVDDATITCTTPAGTSGTADVAVTNAKGTQTLIAGFTYFTHPPTFRATNARLDTDTAGAALSSGPSVCGTGAYRYAVWADQRGAQYDIRFSRSTDGGATWSANDVRLDTDATPGQFASLSPRICCIGPYVYVAWRDWRNSVLNLGDIYFQRSTDNGATWLANDVRIDTAAANVGDAQNPEILCLGTNVYITWVEARTTGATDIYFSRSTDNGATWLPTDVRLDTTVLGTSSTSQQMACRGTNVYVVWSDGRNDAVNDIKKDIFLNRSTDSATWLAADVRLDTDTAGAAVSQLPRIACSGSNVCVIWGDGRNGTIDVYLNRSADNGATWLVADQRLNTGPAGVRYAINSRIAMDGSTAVVTWTEDRTTVNKHDVYINRSVNGGATWLVSDVRVSTDTIGTNEKAKPLICAGGGIVFLVWLDFRNGTKEDVYSNVSADGGVTWLAADVRLNDNTAGANNHDLLDGVWCNGAAFLAGWMDSRTAPFPDIYVTVTVP
jgi:hypothetical protein